MLAGGQGSELMVWMPPFERHRKVRERRRGGPHREEPMSDVHVLAIDLAKRSFQVCATDPGGACVAPFLPIMPITHEIPDSPDYHVEVQGFFYSVPHALIREQVDTRATQRTVEVFHRGKRVAAHARRYGGPRHGTQAEHMPSAHRRYAEWTPERLQRDARGIGPATEALIIAVMASRPHPEQGFRTCLGILRLFRGLEASRVEAASTRAVEIGALSYASVASILKHRLDGTASSAGPTDDAPLLHDNIRGSGYYH